MLLFTFLMLQLGLERKIKMYKRCWNCNNDIDISEDIKDAMKRGHNIGYDIGYVRGIKDAILGEIADDSV